MFSKKKCPNDASRTRRVLVAGLLISTFGLAWAMSAVAEEPEKKPAKRVVIRTTADGKVEVVKAEEDTASGNEKESKDRQALEAMAQRLWTADSAEQTLTQGKQGTRPKESPTRAAAPAGGQRLALRPRPSTAPSANAREAAADGVITPCLATDDETSGIDPCEVARRIGRLEPCRNPEECAAYEAWRQQYGAPGLRAAAPRKAPPATDDNDPQPEPH